MTSPTRRIFFCGVLLLALLALFVLPQGCAKTCTLDSDCSERKTRCSAGGYCIIRCFAGESVACQAGHICDSSGTKCVPGTNNTTDATTPEPTPTESQPETQQTSD